MKKLNVGCGIDIKKGWINLDMIKKKGVNCVYDLREIISGGKLPFEDNSINHIYCSHVLEDFYEPMPIIQEFIRICKVGGKIEIKTPFETNAWGNIYHKRAFTLLTFIGLTNYVDSYGGNSHKPIKIIKLCYYNDSENIGKTWLYRTIIKILIGFCNLFPTPFFERSFLKYLFPILNCHVIYEKTK